MSGPAGWFADVSNDGVTADMWQPCLETGSGHIPCFDVWFDTREECETYIRDVIMPAATKEKS